MNNLGLQPVEAVATNRDGPTVCKILQSSCGNFSTIMYLKKDISVYNKKYIIVLLFIVFITITNVT